MARRVGALSQASEDEERPAGETFEGQIQTQAEVDADRVTRENEDDVIAQLTSLDSGGEVTWQVFRLLPANEQGYLFDLATAELTLANIRARAGSGKYKVKGTRANGTYAGQRTVWIAPLAPSSGTALVAAPTGPKIDDYFAFIERSKLSQKEELKFWAGLLVPVFAPLLAGLFTRKESGIGELVTALKGLKGMSDGESTADQLAKTRQLIDLVKELSPEKDSVGSTWPDIIRDGLQAAAPMLGSLVSARAAARQGAVAQTPAVSPNPAPEGDPMILLFNWFRNQIPMLVQRAAKNSDPTLYAELLADSLPAGVQLAQLKGMLDRADWWDMFRQFAPAVTPYEGWFVQLREALMGMIEEAQAQTSDRGDSA